MKTFLHFTLFVLVFTFSTSGQTYTTIKNGNWDAAATWLAGKIPPATITSAQTVNVYHEVNFNQDAELKIYGRLNIAGGVLQFPALYAKRTSVYSGGQLVVINGSFLQNTAERKSDVNAEGGRIRFDNALVTVGKGFNATAGSRRLIKNSTIQIGEGFSSQGTTTSFVFDTIQYSTISLGGSGHFSIKNHCKSMFANANIFVTNGGMKVGDSASIATLSSAADNYAFNKLMINGDLDNGASWTARVYSHCISGDVEGTKAADVDFVRAEDCSLPSPAPYINSGQLIINEVYTDPGAGNHEFFELYNIGNQPESADNYTLVSFFKHASEKGFYVLDMPELMIEPRAFFVGAAAFPFNFQSHANSILANFNWNKLNISSTGRLTKWVQSTTPDNTDGNLFYNVATLPTTGLNDIFSRITGDNSFTIFLFKNGNLVNRMITGAGGNTTLSSLVTSMPTISIDMLGAAPDFSVNFSSMVNIPVEAVSMDAGSDNGFIREIDGACGTWKKSSSSVTHTPQEPNGMLSTGTNGTVDIVASITKGTITSGSTVTYTVSSTSNVFPVELKVYVDNGLIPGQFDVSDSLVDTKSATTSGQTFTSTFKPYNADVLIVVRQASGCIDRIKFTPQGSMSTLPVAFQKLSATLQNNTVLLKWKVADPQEVDHFIVQRSTDQRNFTDIGYILSDGAATEYELKDQSITNTISKYYYRIKAYSMDNKIVLSNICVVRLSNDADKIELSIYPNPVASQFTLLFPQSWQGKNARLDILSMNGSIVGAQYLSSVKLTETIEADRLPKGAYLIRVVCGEETLQKTILKY